MGEGRSGGEGDYRGLRMPSRGEPPEHGFFEWLVFLTAIGVMLSICVGCTAWLYAPLFTG